MSTAKRHKTLLATKQIVHEHSHHSLDTVVKSFHKIQVDAAKQLKNTAAAYDDTVEKTKGQTHHSGRIEAAAILALTVAVAVRRSCAVCEA